MRTRIAPTPSGYLHIGNCVNALLVSWIASTDGHIVLRIDDADQHRYRRSYAEDIFRTLDWLHIRIDEGPRGATELENDFTQVARRARYLQVAQQALALDLAYACACSRQTTECLCDASVSWQPEANALRLQSSNNHPGAVLWRRDDVPAYHLTSIVDDHDFAITHVVRGDDLREATELQRELAATLSLDFPQHIRHHPLVKGADGTKLSKSTGASGPLLHTDDLRSDIELLATRIGKVVDISPPEQAS